MGRKEKSSEEGGGSIMVLYVALMILLLAFFILLNAMGNTSEGKVKSVYQSLVGSFGFAASGISPMGADVSTTGAGLTSAVNPVEQDYNFLRGLVLSDKLQKDVKLLRSGLIRSVNISNLLLFKPDTFELTPEGEAFLEQVASLIKGRVYPLSIKGHTDDAAGAVLGMDNIEISARRALSVLRFFVDRGIDGRRLAAYGLADSRPMVPNTTPENRRQNNRVELVFDERDVSRHRVPGAPTKRSMDFRGFTFDLPSQGQEQ